MSTVSWRVKFYARHAFIRLNLMLLNRLAGARQLITRSIIASLRSLRSHDSLITVPPRFHSSGGRTLRLIRRQPVGAGCIPSTLQHTKSASAFVRLAEIVPHILNRWRNWPRDCRFVSCRSLAVIALLKLLHSTGSLMLTTVLFTIDRMRATFNEHSSCRAVHHSLFFASSSSVALSPYSPV